MWLLEEPLPILFLGILAEAILLAILVQTSHRLLILAMVLLGLLFAGLLVVEKIVVTDGESVEIMLYLAAGDVQRNDIRAVLSHVSTTDSELRRSVEKQMGQVLIKRAEIKGRPKITVQSVGEVTTAVAEFRGLVVANDKRGIIQDGHVLRQFTVRLRRERDAWKIYEYHHNDPL